MQSKLTTAAPTVKTSVWVATLRKPIGIEGRVAFVWRDPFSLDSVQIRNGDFLFIERDGLLVPYELRDLIERGDGTLSVALTFVSNPTEAKALQGLRVFLPKESILDTPADSLRYGDLDTRLSGHFVEDEHGNPIGSIRHVDQYPMNVVLTVNRKDGGEVLLPLSEELLLEMPALDEPSPAHPLRLRIPDGLL